MTAVATIPEILNAEELRQMDAYWRACNYLCAGMIYLTTIPCCASRSRWNTSRSACSATGAPTPARLSSGFISTASSANTTST